MAEFNTEQREKAANLTLVPKQELRVGECLDKIKFNTTDDLGGGTLAQGDLVIGPEVKKNDILTRLRLEWEAMGASATLNVGLRGADGDGYLDEAQTVADDVNLFTSSPIDVSSAGSQEILLPFGSTYDKDVEVTLSLGGAIWAADKDLLGYLSSIRA